MNHILLAACLIIVFAFTVSAQSSVKIGSTAPAFSGSYLDGTPFELDDLRGRVVVIAFWSTRCAICHHERPKLNDLTSQHDPKKVVFVAVSMENETKLNGYLRGNPFNFKVIPNGFGVVLKYADRTRADHIDMGFPAYFVLDQKGTVRFRSGGYDKAEPLNAAIQWLITK